MRPLWLEAALVVRHIRQRNLVALGIRVRVAPVSDDDVPIFGILRLLQRPSFLRFDPVFGFITAKIIVW